MSPTHSGLLVVTVRTDTKFGVCRGSRGCILPPPRFYAV